MVKVYLRLAAFLVICLLGMEYFDYRAENMNFTCKEINQ